jgi:flagellar motility protein MotE (MotC chaperone)
MKKWLREYRLVPVLLIAAGCLFALKALGLVFDGGYTLGQRLSRTDTITITTVPQMASSTPLRSESRPLELAGMQPSGQRSWMQEMFNYPDVTGSVATPRVANPRDQTIITGSVGATKPKDTAPPKSEPPGGQVQAPETKPAANTKPANPPPPGTPVVMDPSRPTSAAERAILERLHQRRQELDARAREIEIRESLLKAAEKKVEERIAELKSVEARVTAGLQKKDDAEASRFKGIVTMYETMKPRDAAKIFERLDMRVLLDVSTQINPRRMSEILALMTPEAAEKLTVELATRVSGGERTLNPNDLPKIDGKPTGG